MNVSTIINSFFSSRTYLLEIEGQRLLVDCGDTDWFVDIADSISRVLLTHAHYDHIYGLNELLALSPSIKIYTNSQGREMLVDSKKNLSVYHDEPFTFLQHDNIVIVENGEEIEIIDGITARAMFTPGHNPSCITWIVGDNMFTGDSLIPGVKTISNLPGGNAQQAKESERKIMRILSGYKLKLCPGH